MASTGGGDSQIRAVNANGYAERMRHRQADQLEPASDGEGKQQQPLAGEHQFLLCGRLRFHHPDGQCPLASRQPHSGVPLVQVVGHLKQKQPNQPEE